jgi:hypothetical protein
MSALTKHTVVVQIVSPKRLSTNTQLYTFEFMPYLVNREFTAASGTTLGDAAYLPVIKKISGIKFDSSDFIPKNSTIQLDLDNTPGSWGFDRKFTDELDRFSIIGCQIRLYICGDEPGSFTNASALSGLLIPGIISAVRVDTKNQSVSITAETYRANTQPLTARPDPSLPGLTQAASTQSLPFLIGFNVYTKLMPLNSDPQAEPTGSPLGNHTQAYYGFCTDRSIAVAQGHDILYIRDFTDQTYKAFTPYNTAGTVTELERDGTFSANLTLDTDTEIADYIKRGSESFTNRVLTHAIIKFRGNTGYVGSVNGAITLEIYQKAPRAPYNSFGSRPNKTPIARATVEKDAYAAELVLNADFNIAFALDKPVYLNGDVGEELWYSISHDDDDDTNTLSIPRYTGSTSNRWRRKTGKNWRKQASETKTIYADWYCLGAGLLTTGITTDEYGNRPRYYMVGAVDAFTAQEDFDPCNLDIIAYTDGLLDDSSGTVTGSASSLISDTYEVLKLLSYSWDDTNSTWTSNFYRTWNASINANSSDYYYRRPSFAATGNALADQVIREICRQYYVALVPTNDEDEPIGCFVEGHYKYGFTAIQDNEIFSSSYDYKNTESIVNSIEMAYEPDLLNLQADDVFQRGGPKQYRYYLQRKDAATPSIARWGIKPLKNINYSYVNYPPYAGAIADLMLIKLALPAEYFTIEVPYEKFKSIQMFAQLRVYSPRFPSYFGANVGPTLPIDDSGATDEEGSIAGTEEARGEYIRGVVEGIEYLADAGKYATVRYTCRRLRDNDPFYE